MALCDSIKATLLIVQGAYTLAIFIRDCKNFSKELQETARNMARQLAIVENLLDQVRLMADRVEVQSEKKLMENILHVQEIMRDADKVLKDIQRDRNFIQGIFMAKDDLRRQTDGIRQQLHNSCVLITTILPIINTVSIPAKRFQDFRLTLGDIPEKTFSFYPVSTKQSTSSSMLSINLEDIDIRKCLCYMKVNYERVILSYQLRTWSASNPKELVLARRRGDFLKKWQNKSNHTPSSSNSNLDSTASKTVAANIPDQALEFSQFFMSCDQICGMTLTQSCIYIATKCLVTIVSLSQQKIIAQYGTVGDINDPFKDISYIYIPTNDETSLYIVDRAQYVVYYYKINAQDHRLTFQRRYVVIASLSQGFNLISCVVYDNNLYVSDDKNNCLHVFPLNGERQSCYLSLDLFGPFTPGCLCAHRDHLYVANCSSRSPSILVFDKECQPVDWFRNQLLEEILYIDIDPNLNELYILTRTKSTNDQEKRRPLIVSMDLIPSQRR